MVPRPQVGAPPLRSSIWRVDLGSRTRIAFRRMVLQKCNRSRPTFRRGQVRGNCRVPLPLSVRKHLCRRRVRLRWQTPAVFRPLMAKDTARYPRFRMRGGSDEAAKAPIGLALEESGPNGVSGRRGGTLYASEEHYPHPNPSPYGALWERARYRGRRGELCRVARPQHLGRRRASEIPGGTPRHTACNSAPNVVPVVSAPSPFGTLRERAG